MTENFEFDRSLLFLVSDSQKIQRCVSAAQSSFNTPYIPREHVDSIKYWALEPDERIKINEQTDRIFEKVRGKTIKLDPKNPKHMPDIRVWLGIRDCVTAEYYAENRGTSKKNMPTFREIYTGHQNRLRFEHLEFMIALKEVEDILKIEYPENVDFWYMAKHYGAEYLFEVGEIAFFAFPPAAAAVQAAKLGYKIHSDFIKEKEKMKRLEEQASLIESFVRIRASITAVRDSTEVEIAKELEEGKLENEYNGLSYREKVDYAFRFKLLRPLKSYNEYQAKFYFDNINRSNGHLEIEITVQAEDIKYLSPYDKKLKPEPYFIRILSFDKIKVVTPHTARNYASGLNILKPWMEPTEDWDLSNLFEWPVNKVIVLKHKPYSALREVKGQYRRMILKGAFVGSEGRYIKNTSHGFDVLPSPGFKMIWDSMTVPNSSWTSYSNVVLKDYIKSRFDIKNHLLRDKQIVY